MESVDTKLEKDYKEFNKEFNSELLHNIEKIELFFIKVNIVRNFSQGSWPARYQCMLKVVSGEKCGWSELTLTKLDNAVKDTERIYSEWLDKSISQGMNLCTSAIGRIPDMYLESMELALIDLSARFLNQSAVSYLGLNNKISNLPGLECVLQKDANKAAEQAKILAKTHLKLKLFGELELDKNIVSKVREVIPRECYLVADVNEGYFKDKDKISHADIKELANKLKILQSLGLDACEDPAKIDFEQMALLQSIIPDMPIIPDYLLRPAHKLYTELKVVEGHIYNIHPHTMGSIRAMILLAKRIQNGGGKIMIGDNSLIGAACTAWQQIACALEAEWCESIEKPLEYSNLFLDCVNEISTNRDENGICHYDYNNIGFGLDVDSEKLARNSEVYRMLEKNKELF